MLQRSCNINRLQEIDQLEILLLIISKKLINWKCQLVSATTHFFEYKTKINICKILNVNENNLYTYENYYAKENSWVKFTYKIQIK